MYYAYEMKSTLLFAVQREFAWNEMIRECQTHSLVIVRTWKDFIFEMLKNADEEAAWLEETTPQNTRNTTNGA